MKERAVDLGCMLVLFILLHEGYELPSVGAFAHGTTVIPEHQEGQLLQGLARATEERDGEVQFGDEAVENGVTMR